MSELSDHQREQILDALKAGSKIEAIKLYREATGLGLKESKDFIDHLLSQLMKDNPGQYQSSGKGCAAAAILTAGLTIAMCLTFSAYIVIFI